jgi:hypothetical protein
LQQGETWSVCYELCNYFVLDSLVYAARQAGWHVLDAGHCYGKDQYIYVEGSAIADQPPARNWARSGDELPGRVEQFRREHTESVARWQQRIEHFRDSRQSAVLWGSGGRGISFLNAVDPDSVIKAVVDVNPRRQGSFIPGTGHQIVAPQWLQDNQPDWIVISNPLYEREIRAMAASLGVQARFVNV